MQINMHIEGLRELQEELRNFSERRLRAAVATALTRTAVQVRDKIKTAMATSLDKPMPYTVRQLRYVAASAAKPVAAVGFGVVAIQDERGDVIRYQDLGASQTPAGKYLHYQIHGGTRRLKRFEKALQGAGVLPSGWFAVPGQRAKMTAFGNQSAGEIKQIMSWFDAAERSAGSTQNMGERGRARRRRGTRTKAGFEYFISPVGGRRTFTRANGKTGTHSMQPGIYRRTATALGSRVEPVIMFVKQANYRQRFDFYGMAEIEGSRLLPTELTRSINASLERLRGAAA